MRIVAAKPPLATAIWSAARSWRPRIEAWGKAGHPNTRLVKLPR